MSIYKFVILTDFLAFLKQNFTNQGEDLHMEQGRFRQPKVYFTQVSNTALRDNNLSLKAKGLYGLIQSYLTIENFTLYKSFLLKQCCDGKTSFNSAWTELKQNGYLKQYEMRNEKGQIYYEYELFDVPQVDEEPHTENPVPEKPVAVNEPLIINKKNNTKKTNTKSNNTTTSEPQEQEQKSVSSSNKQMIESNTKLKLTSYQTKTVANWDIEKLNRAIEIFNKQDGQFFNLLLKIYNDGAIDNLSNSVGTGARQVSSKVEQYNQMDSRDDWDFDEIEKLEREYINRKLSSK